MKSLMALLMLILPVTSFAQVVYQQVEPFQGEYKSLRDAWDRTSEFCYTLEDKTKQCLPIQQRGEIKVREKGEWGSSLEDAAYVAELSEQAKAVAQNYFRIYIRYMAFGQARFAAHVFFIQDASWGKNARTIFAFGELKNGIAQISSMSFSSGLEYAGAWTAAKRHVAIEDFNNEKVLHPMIVKMNLPLLNVAQEIVNMHAQRSSLHHTPNLIKP